MNQIGENIRNFRKKKGLTQEQLADLLQVSFQTVSAWEKGNYYPQLDKAEKICEALDITMNDLFNEKSDSLIRWELKDQMFSIDHMYKYVRTFAQSTHAQNTIAALPYAEKMHAGQFRKGKGKVPYIYHPLLMACHALALGLHEDELIAACLIHDVCEDCRDEKGQKIQPQDLPVNQRVQKAVLLVTKPQEKHNGWEEQYYEGISHNRLAVIVKVLDRCCNISTMASGFNRKKMAEYIEETERYVMPLLEIMKNQYEDSCYNAAFLIKYQMLSTMESIKRLL